MLTRLPLIPFKPSFEFNNTQYNVCSIVLLNRIPKYMYYFQERNKISSIDKLYWDNHSLLIWRLDCQHIIFVLSIITIIVT